MIIGTTTKRDKLRIIVHNEQGQKPHLYDRFPVAEGQVILSGQVISAYRNTVLNRIEWIRGYNPGTSQAGVIWIARHDSADGDVLAAGTLAGLSSNGDHDISSSRYKTGDTYRVGTELTYDAITGNFKVATQGELVFAKVKRDFNPPVNFGPVYTPAPADSGVSAGVKGGSFKVGRHSEAVDLNLVRFETVPTYVKP